jgi:hypothetical protein
MIYATATPSRVRSLGWRWRASTAATAAYWVLIGTVLLVVLAEDRPAATTLNAFLAAALTLVAAAHLGEGTSALRDRAEARSGRPTPVVSALRRIRVDTLRSWAARVRRAGAGAARAPEPSLAAGVLAFVVVDPELAVNAGFALSVLAVGDWC